MRDVHHQDLSFDKSFEHKKDSRVVPTQASKFVSPRDEGRWRKSPSVFARRAEEMAQVQISQVDHIFA